MSSPEFPLNGVIGIVANSPDEISLAREHQLQCVEMRPDLLLDKGFSVAEVMAMVAEIAESGLRCLFTLRRHDHGGKFNGSDSEQMELCLQAVSSGADIVDVEWDSTRAKDLIAQGVQTIMSYHDFTGMPSGEDLASITASIATAEPAAIKLVPTASTFGDAVRMLKWVADSSNGLPRIGFAMGEAGEFSRILTRSFGNPITYAAFDAPVAPGQIAVDQLLSRYHAHKINPQTRVIGVLGEKNESASWIDVLNQSSQALRNQLVAVPLIVDDFESAQAHAAFLRLDLMIVTSSHSSLIPKSLHSENDVTGKTLVIYFDPNSLQPAIYSVGSGIEDCPAILDRYYS